MGARSLNDPNGTVAPKEAVAKQHVKGHGGKSHIVEDVESGPSKTTIRFGKRISTLTKDDSTE